jgi:hypothetical protein
LKQRGLLPRRWKRLVAYFFFLAGFFLAAFFFPAGFFAASFFGAFFFIGIKNPPFHPQRRRIEKV